MEKVREYKFDNLKILLILLVVLGHIIEPFYKLNTLYLIIYAFHMPVFVYISGYFAKGNKKSIIKPIIIYLVSQTIYFLVYRYILKDNIKFTYLRPIWILWYVFCLAIWNMIIALIKKIKFDETACYSIICLAFVISILCGFSNKIGYDYSLSRLITFFPFFLLGYFTKNFDLKLLKIDNEKNKKIFIYALIAIICIVYFVTLPTLDRNWFYGSYSYQSRGYNALFRIVLSTFSVAAIIFLTNFIPSKNYKITSLGGKTLYIYLLHGLIIKIIYKYGGLI